MVNSFSLRLKNLLLSHNKTQQSVATVIGVSKVAVNKWTKGGAIEFANLQKLAQVFGVDVIWLQHGSGGADKTAQCEQQLRYQSSLLAAEERLSIAQHDADIVTWEWDIASDKLQYSSNVEKVYGFNITHNSDFWPLLDNSQTRFLKKHYQDIIEQGGSHHLDLKINLPSGETRWLSSKATGVKNSNGVVERILGITEANTATVLLRDEHQLMSLALNTLLEKEVKPTAIMSQSANVLAANSDFLALLNMTEVSVQEGMILLLKKQLAKTHKKTGYFDLFIDGHRRPFSIELYEPTKQLYWLRVE